MKKRTLLLLIIMMILVLSACGGGSAPEGGRDQIDNLVPSPPNDTQNPSNNAPKPMVYTITFVDHLGNILQNYEVNEGQRLEHNFVVESTNQWVYSFLGWSSSPNGSNPLVVIPLATEDATHYAVVVREEIMYTVSFVVHGGTQVQSMTVLYGQIIQAPTNPTKEGHAFVAWTLSEQSIQSVQWPRTVTNDITLHASWNERVPLGQYLETLLSGFQLNPFENIPNSMQHGNNLVSENQVNVDYTSFVNLNSIPHGRCGEQWQMVLDNLNQSKVFFDTLSVIEGLSTVSVVAFNNFLDTNPSDQEYFEFNHGIYQIAILFNAPNIIYVVEYTSILPVFGEQTVQLAISYNIVDSSLTGRVQIGDVNVLKYETNQNEYTFAIRYLGVRRAYFNLQVTDEGTVEGSIVEFLGTGGAFTTSSSAFLSIDASGISVIGNKASGMLAFDGTIVELYNRSTGRMLGYLVVESRLGLTFNTLWLNLDEQTGISKIRKVLEANGNNPHTIYVNQSTVPFESKTVGGLSLKRNSRRFDIEFRTQYVSYQQGEEIVHASILVPMLFMQ